MTSKYYESELAYLREEGRAFARIHPSTAGMLAERGNDPDVERLLEGFAFLTGRLRERIDNALPEVIQGLTRVVAPQFLRPMPSVAMIEYAPDLRTQRGRSEVERGTVVQSRPVDGTRCVFRTTQKVDLLPLRLHEAHLDQSRRAQPQLRLVFEAGEGLQAALRDGASIPILLHGESAVAATLMLWLTRYCCGTEVVNAQGHRQSLLSRPFQRMAPTSDRALLPWPKLVPRGFRVLQEYASFMPTLMFVELLGLERLSLDGSRFELVCSFDAPPELEAQIDATNFRLFCTPVINLFDITAEPLRHDVKTEDHLVRAAGVDPEHMEVFEVTNVTGIRRGQPQPTTYHARESYRGSAGAATYEVRRSASVLDEGSDLHLRLQCASSEPALDLEWQETVSVGLLCTNRSLPIELQLGDICEAPRGSSTLAPFTNITAPTPPLRPPLDGALHWRLMAHVAASRGSWTDVETLRGLLGLYNLQPWTSRGQALTRRFDAIASVQTSSTTRVVSGAPTRGMQTRVVMSDEKIATMGEAFVLGCVLDELFSGKAPLNSYNELVVELMPSGRVLRWNARMGQRSLA